MKISVDGEQVAKGQIDKRPIRLAAVEKPLIRVVILTRQSLAIMNSKGFSMARSKKSR